MNQLNPYGNKLQMALSKLHDKLTEVERSHYDIPHKNMIKIHDRIESYYNNSLSLTSFQLIKEMCRIFKVINAIVEQKLIEAEFMDALTNGRNEMSNILYMAKSVPAVQKYQGMFDFNHYSRDRVLDESCLQLRLEEKCETIDPASDPASLIGSPEDELFK
jgi:hypothetical protein